MFSQAWLSFPRDPMCLREPTFEQVLQVRGMWPMGYDRFPKSLKQPKAAMTNPCPLLALSLPLALPQVVTSSAAAASQAAASQAATTPAAAAQVPQQRLFLGNAERGGRSYCTPGGNYAPRSFCILSGHGAKSLQFLWLAQV